MRVRFRGSLVPRVMFERDPRTVSPGCCSECLGVGYLLEQTDEDRPLEAVPCWKCKMFCTCCDRHVLREGHKCS